MNDHGFEYDRGRARADQRSARAATVVAGVLLMLVGAPVRKGGAHNHRGGGSVSGAATATHTGTTDLDSFIRSPPPRTPDNCQHQAASARKTTVEAG